MKKEEEIDIMDIGKFILEEIKDIKLNPNSMSKYMNRSKEDLEKDLNDFLDKEKIKKTNL